MARTRQRRRHAQPPKVPRAPAAPAREAETVPLAWVDPHDPMVVRKNRQLLIALIALMVVIGLTLLLVLFWKTG